MEAQFAVLADAGDSVRPDTTAQRKLSDTVRRYPHAEQYILHEVKLNLGPAGSNGVWVDFQLNGGCDENGKATWSSKVGQDCKLRSEGGVGLSRALMGICKRWMDRLESQSNDQLLAMPNGAAVAAASLTPRKRNLQEGEEPDGQPVKRRKPSAPSRDAQLQDRLRSESLATIDYLLRDKRHLVLPGWIFCEDDAKGVYYRNEQTQQMRWSLSSGPPHEIRANVCFELRFRLEAAGECFARLLAPANLLKPEGAERLRSVLRLQRMYDACQRSARALNQECAKLDLPRLGFELPVEEHHTMWYEAELSSETGAATPLAVHADGNAHAHRLLAGLLASGRGMVEPGESRLLRLRVPPPTARDRHDANARKQYDMMLKSVLTNGVNRA